MYEDDMRCRVCKVAESREDEIHTFHECSILMQHINIDPKITFDHIFGNIQQQISATKYYSNIIKVRKVILEQQNQRTKA